MGVSLKGKKPKNIERHLSDNGLTEATSAYWRSALSLSSPSFSLFLFNFCHLGSIQKKKGQVQLNFRLYPREERDSLAALCQRQLFVTGQK